MEWNVAALLLLATLGVLLLMGVPLGVSLGLVSVGFMVAVLGIDRSLAVISNCFFSFWSRYSLIAVPLFIFMAEFLFIGGAADDIFDIASKWLRRLPGGLAMATIGACAIFATLSGASLGSIAVFGLLAVPQMLKRGYSKRLACGAVGAAGGLAHLIPPSVLMIIYADICEVSAGRMLMAGFMPGIVLALAYGTVVVVWVLRKPDAAPKEPPVTWRERILVLRRALAPLVIVLAVLGTIYSGVATVIEASGLGAFAAFLLAVVSRKISWSRFYHSLLSTIKTSGFILLIAVGAKLLSWVLTYYLIPQNLLRVVMEAGLNRWFILVMIQIMYIFMGTFIDAIGMILVTMPILQPVVLGLGFDIMWFGVLLMVNIEMALVTPPLGFALYIIKGVVPPDVTLKDILYGCLTFCIADCSVLGLVMVFPQIALWLPSMMMG